MNLPTTIDGVIEELDRIIDSTVAHDNYLGLFTIVYRDTTARIKSEIIAGAFEDGNRMHEMDVLFANIYIKAYHDFHAGKQVSRCWKVSFEAARDPLAIVQHIMLGMNAHINLDLAIAASLTMDGEPIEELANDFRKVNEILAGLTNEMQEQLARVSPLMFLLDWIGQRSDEKIIDFSIKIAREQSWHFARELWGSKGADRNALLQKVDIGIERIANRIRHPRTRMLRFVLKVIRRFEKKDVADILSAMRSNQFK